MVRLAFLALVLVACNKDKDSGGGDTTTDDTGTPTGSVDADGDGFSPEDGDCDDENADVNPDEEEIWYDDVDQDCDGNDADRDLDGVLAPEDCDDLNSGVFPGGEELCDGRDNDCDGETDEDASDALSAFADADADGFGDPSSVASYCDTVPDGYTTDASDCDDTRAHVHPNAPEVCDDVDNDCDGAVNEDGPAPVTWYADGDGDGFGTDAGATIACDQPAGFALTADDCNDADPAVNPGAEELCDELDRDCDGQPANDPADGTVFFVDTDGDGFGDAGTEVVACATPEGAVEDATDCDDTSPASFPGAVEACDGLDNDCNGVVDDDQVTGTYYADADGDGFGDEATAVEACAAAPGFTQSIGDCDDGDASANPEGVEVCDGADNDCDGLTDEDGTGTATWYADVDGDGFGDAGVTMEQCAPPEGYVAEAGDCDDAEWRVSPAGVESCDGVDNDCDLVVDEDDAAGAITWYADADADTYGDGASPIESCAMGAASANASDCDDADAATNPGAGEVCDDADNDCDGLADEDLPLSTWYGDADLDGHGDPAAVVDACAQPGGTSADDLDCDDADAAVSPDADELCNGVDDDCDGATDEDGAVDGDTFYADADSDGYGDAATTASACSAPAGFVSDATDCDDGAPTVNPGAPEVCDTDIDNDCDGLTNGQDPDLVDGTDWYTDADGDGYGSGTLFDNACEQPPNAVADSSDCDDASATVFPGATEACNGADDDCDGTVDDGAPGSAWYADADGDGYGDPLVRELTCEAPAGYVADSSDCDDANAAVSPDADEICNGLDDNCSGDTEDEAGSAAYEGTDGEWTDVTATLAAGTVADPILIGDASTRDLVITDGTLHLCEGTWYAKVITSSATTDVVVEGAGADITTLSAGGIENGSVVSVTSGIVDLSGLTITGGKGSSGTTGGGIIVGEYTTRQSVPNVTLTDCIVTGNNTTYGGGLAIYNYGWISLVDTLVDANTASSAGGGLWVQNYGYLSCSAETLGAAGFVANSATYGAGVYLSSASGGGLDAVGCDWGDYGTGDDNGTYDVQWYPRTSSTSWCYGDAASLDDTVSCSGGSCTASTETCP